jgi:hypothetical protein
VYTLTPAGEAAFTDWLDDTDEQLPFEVRAEGMLKLFFSDAGTPEQRVRNLRAMRDAHQRTLDQLTALHDKPVDMPTGPRLTLELGIDLHRLIVEWCEQADRRLTEEMPRDAD